METGNYGRGEDRKISLPFCEEGVVDGGEDGSGTKFSGGQILIFDYLRQSPF